MKTKYKWYIGIATIASCFIYGPLIGWLIATNKSYSLMAISTLVWFIAMVFVNRQIGIRARKDPPTDS